MKKPAGVGPPEKAPHPGVLEGRIRQLAKAGAFSYGKHVFERKRERGIDLPDALEVLRLGSIDGPVQAGVNAGEWKCKIVTKMDNGRRLGVVTVVIQSKHLFLITWNGKTRDERASRIRRQRKSPACEAVSIPGKRA